ncbi:MAG: 30S ribosomal protein S7 [Candidatus Heimdallarchaeota archaeon]
MARDTKAKKESPKKKKAAAKAEAKAKEDKKKAATKAASKKDVKPKKTDKTKAASKKETKTAPKKDAKAKADTKKKTVTKTKEPTKKADAKTAPKKATETKAKAAPKKEVKAVKPEEAKVEKKAAEAKTPKPKAVPAEKAPAKAVKPKKPAAPKEEEKEEYIPSFDGIKLFNTWSYTDLVVVDPGLKAYICLKPVITPHTGGRYEHKRFKKAEMPITERLANKLMRRRKGTGKKERMIKAIKIAFEIINIKTGKNPIQVLIDAIQNAAPREEVTRITYGGMAQLQSVDVAPMRRVDIALTNIVEGVYKKSFNSILTAEEVLANELVDAADNKSSSFSIGKMLEIERVALSAR